MRQKIILPLGVTICLSLASLAGGQTAPASTDLAPQDKSALLTAERARVKQQNQVIAEKSRIINAINRLPQNERKKTLANQVKNSLIFQQACGSEGSKNQAQGLRQANSGEGASMSEIIARLNRLPPAERKSALREAMRALKGKKLETAQ